MTFDLSTSTCREQHLHQTFMIFTALHVMQTRYSDENYVRLSVCLSVTRVYCDKTVESFLRRRMGMVAKGRPLLPEILGQLAPDGAKSPILNR